MTNTRVTADWCGRALVDMLGKQFQIGDIIVRPVTSNRSGNLQIATITDIRDGKLYLSGSKMAINYPSRLLIINDEMKVRLESKDD